jgi:hypothetical protein
MGFSMRGEQVIEAVLGKKYTPESNGQAKPSRPRVSGKLPCIYDAGGGGFWSMNAREEWVCYSRSDICLMLRDVGYSRELSPNSGLTHLEAEICRIVREQDIHFAGPLAGYPVGEYTIAGKRILVTKGANPVKPRRGKWPTFKRLLEELFSDQAVHVMGWLKCGLEAIAAGPPFRPGQLLAVAGPWGAGKSLFQGVITEIFGGRCAKPYRYLTGGTQFNSDLFGAEHLSIEDEAASTDLRTRRTFGASLKNLCVNELQSFHAKGRDALSLTPFWRVSITLNEEPENLLVLPPLDESIRDKIILLRAGTATMPFDPEVITQRRAYREQLSAELPGFVHALQRWKIPPGQLDVRYGSKAYHDPSLVQELEELAPEWRLWSLIEGSDLFSTFNNSWEGTSGELERWLRKAFTPGEMDRLFSWNNACGTYLSRLAKKLPDKIEKFRAAGNSSVYRISKG